MKSISVVCPNKVEIVDIPKPVPGSYEVVIKNEISFLCNATDRKLIEGHFPGMEDEYNYPLLLGHETAGIVDAVGEKVQSFVMGDCVISGLILKPTDVNFKSGWGGFSEYVVAVDDEAMKKDGKIGKEDGYDELWQIMKKVPDDIPVEAAGLLCTWREVYGGIRDFMLKPQDEILVFGAGPVGLSFVKFLKLLDFEYVACVDLIKEKLEIAMRMGADDCCSANRDSLEKLVHRRGKKFDAIIDAVGSPSIINMSLPFLRMAGSMCVYGVIADSQITLDKSSAPYNFNLFMHQWPTRKYEAEAQEPLCTWIRNGKLRCEEFITGKYHFQEIDKALNEMKKGLSLKTLLYW